MRRHVLCRDLSVSYFIDVQPSPPAMRPVLLIPGISNSGPAHWQSRWQALHPGVVRVVQRDWDHPDCGEWADALDASVRAAVQAPILVAHSLGCLVVAHWASASRSTQHANAALLVAVPDPSGTMFPREATGFGQPPGALAIGRVTIVSSSDDPYSSPELTARCAADWKGELVDLGAAGHINASSGLGDWREGWSLVERWRRG